MCRDITEFEIETDDYFFRVQMEYGDATTPGIGLNGYFFPMYRPDEAKDAMLGFLDEVTLLDRQNAYAAGYDKGKFSGWAEGYEDGVSDGRRDTKHEQDERLTHILAEKDREINEAFTQGRQEG